MRKWNAVITVLIMIFFLIHGIMGAFQLFGIGSDALKTLAWIAVGLLGIHTVIGIILTAESIRVWKKTGTGYFRQNLLFWARRLSGFAVLILMTFHMTSFGYQTEAGYRLREFNSLRLAANLLLVFSLLVHIISNVRPVLIALGSRRLKKWAGDILLILSVLLLVMAVSMIIYYLRWQRI